MHMKYWIHGTIDFAHGCGSLLANIWQGRGHRPSTSVGARKLEWLPFSVVSRYLQGPSFSFVTIDASDRETTDRWIDRQTDRIAMAIPCIVLHIHTRYITLLPVLLCALQLWRHSVQACTAIARAFCMASFNLSKTSLCSLFLLSVTRKNQHMNWQSYKRFSLKAMSWVE